MKVKIASNGAKEMIYFLTTNSLAFYNVKTIYLPARIKQYKCSNWNTWIKQNNPSYGIERTLETKNIRKSVSFYSCFRNLDNFKRIKSKCRCSRLSNGVGLLIWCTGSLRPRKRITLSPTLFFVSTRVTGAVTDYLTIDYDNAEVFFCSARGNLDTYICYFGERKLLESNIPQKLERRQK